MDAIARARLLGAERRERALRIAALAVLLAALCWLALRGLPVSDAATGADCAAYYARAVTAQDSAVVDARRPRWSKTGQATLTCGEWRRASR